MLKQLHVKEKQVNEYSERLTEKEQLMSLQKQEVDSEASKIESLLDEKRKQLEALEKKNASVTLVVTSMRTCTTSSAIL